MMISTKENGDSRSIGADSSAQGGRIKFEVVDTKHSQDSKALPPPTKPSSPPPPCASSSPTQSLADKLSSENKEGEHEDVEAPLPVSPPPSPVNERRAPKAHQTDLAVDGNAAPRQAGCPDTASSPTGTTPMAPREHQSELAVDGTAAPKQASCADPASSPAATTPIPPSASGSRLASPEDGLRDGIGWDRLHRRRTMREGPGHRDDTRFRQRLIQHTQKDLLFELRADGTYHMMEMTVRDACNYVHEIVAPYTLDSTLSPKGEPSSVANSNVRNRPGSNSGARPRPGSSGGPVSQVGGSSLNLHQRDMRQLFSSQSKSEPAFTVRRNCILINFETLRGIVLVDRLLLVVDTGADSILMDVRRAVLESTEDIYEFELKAVEALLSVSSKSLEKEVKEVKEPVAGIMHTLEGHHSRATSAENNDRFRVLLNKINVLESRTKARRRALLMVLEDDADLAMMNLTRMAQNPEEYVGPLSEYVLQDHEEMELLLEAYLQDTNTIYNELELLQSRARSTEAQVMVKLDIARNRILTAGLVFSMASTCLTLGTLLSGIFGMNLLSGMEENDYMFRVVALTSGGLCAAAFLGVFTAFYRQGILVS